MNTEELEGDLTEEEIDAAVGSEELLNEDAIDMHLASPHDVHEAPESMQ